MDQLALDDKEIARIFDVACRPDGFRVERIVELLRERFPRGTFDGDLCGSSELARRPSTPPRPAPESSETCSRPVVLHEPQLGGTH